jgi:hypothetical protein
MRKLILVTIFSLTACVRTAIPTVDAVVSAGVQKAERAAAATGDTQAAESLRECAGDLRLCQQSCVESVEARDNRIFNQGLEIWIWRALVLGLAALLIMLQLKRKDES